MNIYIDESGPFLEDKHKENVWSVVASLSTPSSSEQGLAKVIQEFREKLKKENPKSQNFRKNEDVLDFIRKLQPLNLSLFSAVINRSQDESFFQNAVHKFDEANLPEGNRQIASNPQLQFQANLFLELLNSTFWGTYIRYARTHQEELKKNPSWIVDQKAAAYEEFTKKSIEEFIKGENINYKYEYTPKNKIIKLGKIFPHDSILRTLDQKAQNILLDEKSKNSFEFSQYDKYKDITFTKSNESDGIQVVGILAGFIKGCLGNRFGKSNTAIARALASLMIKKPAELSVIHNHDKKDTEKHNKFIPIYDKLSNKESASIIKLMRQHAIKI